MATSNTSNDDPSAGLIGSQLQTYQQLIAMGFNANDCATVAQIFGSNLEGAIDCMLNGGVANLQQQQPLQQQPIKQQVPPKEELVEFRIISCITTILINGYVRKQKELKDVIPSVIQELIVKFMNLYFIRLNYNIHNDDSLIEEETQMDTNNNNDVNISDKEEEKQLKKDKEFSKPFTCNYLVLQSNISEESNSTLTFNSTLRDIAKKLEKSYNYDYENKDLVPYYDEKYAFYVHIWMKFKEIKSIYPVVNSRIKEGKITLDSIDKFDKGDDDKRWVEIPSDFENARIIDLDALIATMGKDYILQLGIEKYDKQRKLWPFRQKELVPNNEDPSISQESNIVCVLC